MRHGRFPIVAAALVALFLVWYLASPWWTLRRMDAAARAGDWATVESYMDMEAVHRASAANAEAGLRGALQEVREARNVGERTSAESSVEYFRRMARAGPVELARDVEEAIAFRPSQLIAGSLWVDPHFKRSGLDEFVIRKNATPSPGTFVFRRHGLGWKLDEVRWGWPEGLGPP